MRGLLADIQDVRHSKIRSGLLSSLGAGEIKINNLTMMEVNTIRPFFITAMHISQKLKAEAGAFFF